MTAEFATKSYTPTQEGNPSQASLVLRTLSIVHSSEKPHWGQQSFTWAAALSLWDTAAAILYNAALAAHKIGLPNCEPYQ